MFYLIGPRVNILEIRLLLENFVAEIFCRDIYFDSLLRFRNFIVWKNVLYVILKIFGHFLTYSYEPQLKDS